MGTTPEMPLLKNPALRRYWFALPGRLGIGVTAFSLDEAEALARKACQELGWAFETPEVIQDVDVRTLDQNHVIPNMLPPNFHGVWFPMLASLGGDPRGRAS